MVNEIPKDYNIYHNDVRDFFLNLQVWGTPEQCVEKIKRIHQRVGHDSYVAVFSYGGMPHPEAERSMRLFAEKVMPELKAFDPATAGSGRTA